MKKFTTIMLLVFLLFPYVAGLSPVVEVAATQLSNEETIVDSENGSENAVSGTEGTNGEINSENSNSEKNDEEIEESNESQGQSNEAEKLDQNTDVENDEVENPNKQEVSENQNVADVEGETSPTTDEKVEIKQNNDKSSCNTIISGSMNSDLYPGDSTQISGELTVNPDANTDGLQNGDRWETITIKLSDNLKPLDPVSFVNDTILSPNTLEDMYDPATNTITLTIADYYELGKGIVEQFNFYVEFVNANDLDKGSIDFTVTSKNGETCESSVDLTYHDPNTWSVDKKRIEPTGKYVVVGDEVTYEVSANATGTADAPELIQLIDKLPPGVELVDADGGVVNGDTITWDLTDQEKKDHQATRKVTVKITSDEFTAGDKLTNNAQISVDGKVVDNAKVEDVISDDSVIVPGKTQKNAHAGETGVGGSIEPGGEIYWTFDDINVDGVGTLNNYRVIDEFPKDNILHLDKIDFGSYQAPNQLVKVEVVYTDESGKAPLEITSITPGGSQTLTQEQGEDVKQVIYYFDTLELPFNVDANDVPGVHTTVTDDIDKITDPNTGEAIDKIENDAHFEFDINTKPGGESSYTCPPPYEVKPDSDPTDDKVTCTADGGDTINVAETPAVAGIEKSIISKGPYYKGDVVDYQVEVFLNKKSLSDMTITNLTDIIPDKESYVDGSFKANKVGDNTPINFTVDKTRPLAVKFTDDIVLKPGEKVVFNYQTKIDETTSGTNVNKVYVNTKDDVTSNGIGQVIKEPEDFNNNGKNDNVLFDQADHQTNPIKVTTDKTIEGFNRDFLPETVVDSNGKPISGDSVVPYIITITNDKQSGVIHNPEIIDSLPNVVTYVNNSASFDAPITAQTPIVTGAENDNNSAQKVTFKFDGDLQPGESIQIKFKAKINDYAQFGRFENNVELKKDPGAIYTSDSTFKDDVSATITGIAGQSIKKDVDLHYTEAGEAVTYTITMNNTGTYNLSGLTLKDDVPRSDDGRVDPDKSTVATEVENTKLIGLPIATINGKPVGQEDITYAISYIDNNGVEHEESVDTDRLNEIQLAYGADSIKQLRMEGNSYIFNPGTEIVIKYVVEVPNSAKDDAEFYNNASLTSDILNESNDVIRDMTSTSATVETIIKAPEKGTYKIGDLVYYDYNKNNIFDGDDEPVDGLTVELYKDDKFDGNFDQSTAKIVAYSLTDSHGNYLFPGLEPGDYQVKIDNDLISSLVLIDPSEGYTFSTNDKTVFPDKNSGAKGPTFNYNMDFAIQYGSVSGMYFYDANYNKILDGSEGSITNQTPGVKDSELEVDLQRKNGGSYVNVDQMTTVNGKFSFNRLPAGDYRLKAKYDGNTGPYVYTTPKTLNFSIKPGEDITNKDFGLVEPAEINGTIWNDFDMKKDFNEDGVKSIEINLFKGNNSTPFKTMSTINDGTYDFTRLVPGDYRVEFKLPTNSDYVNGGDSDFTDGKTIKFSIKPKDVVTYNGGIYYYATIIGNYYEDMNYSLNKDSNDLNVTNKTIKLLDDAGTEIKSTKTDGNGNYKFTKIIPRQDYQINFSKDANAEYIDGSKTTDTIINTNGEIAVSQTDVIPNETLKEQNGSIVVKSKLSGVAFEDVNGDDLNNGSDKTIANVMVTLYDENNQVIATTTTDSNGHYEFNDLYPGKYHVEFNDISNYFRSEQDKGSDDKIDSDVDASGVSNEVELKSHDGGKVIDAGYYQNVKISGITFEDKNTDGKDNSGDVKLVNTNADLYLDGKKLVSTTTDSNGYYEFKDLKPGKYQVVFSENTGLYPTIKGTTNQVGDSDIDNKEQTSTVLVPSGTTDNRNFDGGYIVPASISGTVFYEETPTEDLKATFDAGTDTVAPNVKLSLIDTDTNKTVATTMSAVDGTYRFDNLAPHNFKVVSNGALGYEHLTVDNGIDNTGSSAIIPLGYGENVTKVDNGLFTDNLIIGDHIWEDTNMNGLQELSVEPGISDVKVELYNKDDQLVATTKSDVNGQYMFVLSEPGTYYFKVDTPAGYKITKPNNLSAGEEYDSDLKLDGTTDKSFVDSNEGYHDFGFIALSSVSGNVYRDIDSNGSYNNSDRNLKDQPVELYNEKNELVASTMTDAAGNYKFDGLVPGDYQIRFNQLTTAGYWTVEADGKLQINNLNKTAMREVKIGYDVDITDEDAGYENNSTIAGYTYEDMNGNGQFNNLNDKMLENTPVALVDVTENKQIATTSTDSNGYYEFKFENPDNHEYKTTFTLNNMNVSTKLANNKQYDNDTNADLTTDVVKVNDGSENKVSFDAAVYQPISLGGVAYEDVVYDGKYTDTADKTDQWIKDVEVELYADNTKVATTSTNVDGQYEFTNLKPANYQVKFAKLSGQEFSILGTKDVAKDNDATTDGTTAEYNLTSGMKNYVSYDAAYYIPASISGTIFHETNPFYNKYAYYSEANDVELAGVNVTLYTADGTKVADVDTDNNGYYEFNGLEPKTYYVTAADVPKEHYLITVGGIKDNQKSNNIELAYAENVKNIDGGVFYDHMYLGDTVFEDENVNGIYDAGEKTIANVTVNLYENGKKVQTTTTDKDGKYQFEIDKVDLYNIEVELPAGYRFTDQEVGSDEKIDSNVNDKGVSTADRYYEDNNTLDAGLVNLGTISGYVYRDLNENGSLENSDSVTGEHTVILHNLDTDEKTEMKTDSNGYYEFTDLEAGNYEILFATSPVGDWHQASDKLLDIDASNNAKRTVTLANNQDLIDQNAGYTDNTIISGHVYESQNANGYYRRNIDKMLKDINVTLIIDGKRSTMTTTTDSNGYFEFKIENIGDHTYQTAVELPTNYTGYSDQVANSQTYDNDADANGLSNVITVANGTENNVDFDTSMYKGVNLGGVTFEDQNYNSEFDNDEKALIDQKVTLFKDNQEIASTTTDADGKYEFTDLKPGKYSATISKPTDYTYTTVGQEHQANVSDVDNQGNTPQIALASGQDNYVDYDAGSYKLSTISGHVYRDVNKDGALNINDKLTNNHQVILVNKTTGEELTTMTDADGYYEFTDLMSGDYEIKFDQADVGNWIENVDNELLINNELATRNITLDYATDIKNQDAGYIVNTIISGYAYENILADGIYNSETDKLLSGIEVTLFEDGEAVATTTTDDAGYYEFNIDPVTTKQYYVTFDMGAKYRAATAVNNNKEYDNDINEVFTTKAVNVDAGIDNQVDFDAAVYLPAELGGYVYNDENQNSKKDDKEQFISGIEVKLYQGGKVIATTTTDANGYYEFTNLKPGEYTVEINNQDYLISVISTDDEKYGSDFDPNTKQVTKSLVSGESNFIDFDGGLFVEPTVNPDNKQDPNNKVENNGDVKSSDKNPTDSKDKDNQKPDVITNIKNTGAQYKIQLLLLIIIAIIIMVLVRRKMN